MWRFMTHCLTFKLGVWGRVSERVKSLGIALGKIKMKKIRLCDINDVELSVLYLYNLSPTFTCFIRATVAH
jgi:hypothetical protein